ncbi:hypothetical protein G7Z17_g701 [Cylindrodendrum hubeiense]|uniref:Uncharacterized protein n=1 Tax=Cylindrodendrum hubeiense TaxID=595255 RepID=A0A9P5LM48_9HYPO|nr:hypothetical protein G7Z17_g701 [Cylindrodendrum hubeiense]
MNNSRTGTLVSTSTTSSTRSSKTRVLVFELDTDLRRSSTLEDLDKEEYNERYQYNIQRGQRYVNVDIPSSRNSSEAGAHVAKVQIPIHAWVGRMFGSYKEMLAVSAT